MEESCLKRYSKVDLKSFLIHIIGKKLRIESKFANYDRFIKFKANKPVEHQNNKIREL